MPLQNLETVDKKHNFIFQIRNTITKLILNSPYYWQWKTWFGVQYQSFKYRGHDIWEWLTKNIIVFQSGNTITKLTLKSPY